MPRISVKGLSIWGKLGIRFCPIITAKIPFTNARTLEIMAGARHLGELSIIRRGSEASVAKLQARISSHKNLPRTDSTPIPTKPPEEINPPQIITPKEIIRAWGKVEYDALTGSIIDKIGTDGYDDKSITGLINFETGQMHLMEDCSHEQLAQQHGLQESETSLRSNWYGFNLTCLGPISLKVSPMSGQFGGIPIKYAAIFEEFVRGLSENTKKMIFVSFYQFNYKRSIPLDRLKLLPPEYISTPIPKSLSDEELIKRFPFLSSQ